MKRLLLAALALVSCQHPPDTRAAGAPEPASSVLAPRVPDAPFRASAPPPERAAPFVPNRVRSFVLANGIRVFTYEQPGDLAALSVSFPLLASTPAARRRTVIPILAPALLVQTKSFSYMDIGAAKLRAGARIRSYVGDDDLQIQVVCRSDSLDDVLPLVADTVIHPSLVESEIAYRRSTAASWQDSLSSRPNEIVTMVHDELLFGPQHPYGVWLAKTRSEIDAATQQDAVLAYESLRDPRRMTIAVAGTYDEASLRPRLEALFAPLRADAPPAVPAPSAPAPEAPRFVLVDRPAATTVRLRAGAVLPHLDGADDFAGLVLQQIVGSYTSGRLHDRLSVQLGLTDSTDSSYRNVAQASEFAITVEAPAARAADLAREVEAAFASLARGGITEGELEAARDALAWEHAGSFERVQNITWAMTSMALRGHDPHERFQSFERMVRAVTAEDVKRLASRFFAPDRIKTVMMGDVSRIREPLAKAGYRADQERSATSSGQ